MHTVFIGDDNTNWLNTLAARIAREPDLQLVAKAQDGRQALEFIERLRPDIVILDIVMPEYDGVHIVSHIRNQMENYDPLIYILSGIGTDTYIKALNEMYVDYYSLKPIALESLIQNLKMTLEGRDPNKAAKPSSHSYEDDPEESVKAFLRELGMPPHRLSTQCTTDALMFYLHNPSYDRILTKILYPEIAQKYKLNNSSVERNIRTAIAQIQKNNTGLYQSLFSYKNNAKITNGEFLSVASDYLCGQLGISTKGAE